MYPVSEEWEKAIYEDSECIMNLYINEELINPDYILDFNIGHELFTNNEFCLGSTPSKYIEFKIYKDNIPSSIESIRVEYGLLINDYLKVSEVNEMLVGTLNKINVKSLSTSNTSFEIIPLGIFNCIEDIREDDETITIKANDNMMKFIFNYDGSELTYPLTLKEVLDDICLKAGVELRLYFFFK